MVFISAQPDELYFLWQLKVQMYNFRKFDIEKDSIILLGYKNEPSKESIEFQSKTNAKVYFYKDERKNPNRYIPSIRLHLLSKYFKENPNKNYFFYHDCDIIFRELPNFNKLTKSNNWCVSDTISYIGANYIKSKSEKLFERMCQIVTIDKQIVEDNQNNSGGAQYLINNLDYKFWEKVEKDSIKLYEIMNFENKINPKLKGKEIQSWTADMWALLWNGWLCENKTFIDQELNFSWATNHIDCWNEYKTYHNAGVVNQSNLFKKQNYRNKEPFYDDFSFVSELHCSKKYVEELKNCPF